MWGGIFGWLGVWGGWAIAIASKLAPTLVLCWLQFWRLNSIKCGSELARDCGLSGAGGVGPEPIIIGFPGRNLPVVTQVTECVTP